MDGSNHYGYVSGNPIKYTDPTGLAALTRGQSGEHSYGETMSNALAKGWKGVTAGGTSRTVQTSHGTKTIYKSDNSMISGEVNGKYYTGIDYVNACSRIFDTIEQAAFDFAYQYNSESIIENKEFSVSIYEINDVDGIKYTYTDPIIGTENMTPSSLPSNGETVVATVHTHSAFDKTLVENKNGAIIDWNNIFSDADIKGYNRKQIMGYIATPNGTLQFYNHKTGQSTIISKDIPSDRSDPSRKNDNTVNISLLQNIIRMFN